MCRRQERVEGVTAVGFKLDTGERDSICGNGKERSG